MDPSSPSDDSQVDFAALLEESFAEVEDISRGDLLTGVILAVDDYGVIVDVGLKRDGVVPRSDIEALGEDFTHRIGERICVMVVDSEDRDGNLIVSVQQALASKDWDAARRQMESGDVYEGTVVAANKGGLIVPYGELRGFVPASHVVGLPRGLDDEARVEHLSKLIGETLDLKIIEVNPRRRRLVLSQRLAQRESREEAKRRLLRSLKEGDIVRGTVSSLRDFGAFVDLGGADGLIHVSELAWHRVHHPSEVVKVGMEVDAYVLQLDQEAMRIGLSLKRLQPNPWDEIERDYEVGQLVEGTVSRVVSFGAFVELPNGIEALLHVSEMGAGPARRVEDVVQPGQRIVAEIINLEPHRQRMGLSIKNLAGSEELDNPPEQEPLPSESDSRSGEDGVMEEAITEV